MRASHFRRLRGKRVSKTRFRTPTILLIRIDRSLRAYDQNRLRLKRYRRKMAITNRLNAYHNGRRQ